MEVQRDEACALKVARALSYISFPSLEKWFGEPGFIKIFQGLREEGSDLGWAVLLGSIECALSGDRHLPQAVLGRIIRQNRVTVQHLHELYPGAAPVRPHPGGFRIHPLDYLPEEALPPLGAAVRGFGEGTMGLGELQDEMYRLHTPEMMDSLYYHAVLAAKSVGHPISAHMAWKAVSLLSGGALPSELTDVAIARLEGYQREHLGAAIRRDPRSQSTVLDRFSPAPPEQAARAPLAGWTAASYRERAQRYLEERGIRESRSGLGRFAELSGYEEAHIDQLLQPFILRCYSSEDEPAPDPDLLVAFGPPEVDMVAMLEGIARGFGLPHTEVSYRGFGSAWTGELENDLLRAIARARRLAEKGRGLPAMLLLADGPGGAQGRAERGGATAEEVIRALGVLLSGPRRREAMGEGGRSSVITVATAHSLSVVDPILRDRLTILRFEPPSAQELEKLLVRSVVGRYYLCDLDRISFQSLAEDASGLAPGRIEEAAKRAKLAALDRRARELGTRLFSSSARMRERIRESYLITQEDLWRALAEQKRAPGRVAAARPAGEDLASRPAEPWARQTDLWHWGAGPGGRSTDGRP